MTWIADGLHRTEAGHLVPRDAVVPPLRGHHGVLHVGMRCTVQGPIQHGGAVATANRSKVLGGIWGGHEVVVGAGTFVDGPIHCQGRIVVQDGARTGDLHARGDILLLGSCRVGNVDAGGDIVVVGQPQARALRPGGRITTRPW